MQGKHDNNTRSRTRYLVRTNCIRRNNSFGVKNESPQLQTRPIELIVETQLRELCDTSGTSVGRYFSEFDFTELQITPRSAVNKELAYFYDRIIKLELAVILIMRH